MRVENDLAVAAGRDRTAAGILHAADAAIDVGPKRRVLERQIAIVVHRAIFHDQILRVAQGLRTGNPAVHQLQPFRVPAEVLAVEHRVIDRHVLRIPKRVLRMNLGVADRHVTTILERIVPVLHVILDPDILTVQEKIVGTVHPDVFQVHVTAVPQRLLRVRNPHVLEPDTVHLAKHLRRLDQSVAHAQIARIPQRGAGSLRKKTFPYDEAVVMPEMI